VINTIDWTETNNLKINTDVDYTTGYVYSKYAGDTQLVVISRSSLNKIKVITLDNNLNVLQAIVITSYNFQGNLGMIADDASEFSYKQWQQSSSSWTNENLLIHTSDGTLISLLKITSDLSKVLWKIAFDSLDGQVSSSMLVDKSENIIFIVNSIFGGSKLFLNKINNFDGLIIWQKEINGADSSSYKASLNFYLEDQIVLTSPNNEIIFIYKSTGIIRKWNYITSNMTSLVTTNTLIYGNYMYGNGFASLSSVIKAIHWRTFLPFFNEMRESSLRFNPSAKSIAEVNSPNTHMTASSEAVSIEINY